jgi:DNA-binding beta-propeller fold protein YncE
MSNANARPDSAYYAYVVESLAGTVVKYDAHCAKQVAGFSTGTADPEGIAIDASGKIYVANGADNSVTTYVNGKPVTPIITNGISDPRDVTIDKSGKIYVANYGANTVTTYNPDGSPASPTITEGLDGPQGIDIDNSGKVYVTNGLSNNLTTYLPNGKQTTPTIKHLADPYGVIASSKGMRGEIYVANRSANSVVEFTPQGSLVTKLSGFDEPEGMAKTRAGGIFVANYGDGSVWAEGFCGRGIHGLDGPSGIAIRKTK